MASAAGSSGFGSVTVGKSPSGCACSGTIVTFLKPALANAWPAIKAPVP